MQPPRTTWRIPAWLLSLMAHLGALLALAVLLRPALPEPRDERDREVGIVLASRESPAQVDYFDGPDAQSDSPTLDAANESSEGAAGVPVDALPPADAAASELLSSIPLPELPGGPGNVQLGTARATPLVRTAILPGVGDEAILAEEAARRAAMARKGPATRLSIFGSGEAVGNSFVFLIDRSRSMGGEGLGAISAAEKELAAALDRLGPQHRFQVIAYHQQPVYVGSRKLLDATDENKQAMKQFFAELLAYGGTQHETALFSAMHLEPDVIFLLTDGGDPYLNDRQIDAVTRHNDGRTAIHCIQFGFGATPSGNNFMQKLASRNHGSYGYVDMSK
jgi:uncharacterized protein YegL